LFSFPRNDRKKHVSMPINICKLLVAVSSKMLWDRPHINP
jgi:hypothetical protein